jgi:hypothetical protein
MQRVYEAANLQEAHLVLHLLSEEGIEARVLNANAQGGLGEIPFTQAYPEIWVMRDDDETRARAIIAVYEERPPVKGTRHCPACGEENPANFETCWHCGQSLP